MLANIDVLFCLKQKTLDIPLNHSVYKVLNVRQKTMNSHTRTKKQTKQTVYRNGTLKPAFTISTQNILTMVTKCIHIL